MLCIWWIACLWNPRFHFSCKLSVLLTDGARVGIGDFERYAGQQMAWSCGFGMLRRKNAIS